MDKTSMLWEMTNISTRAEHMLCSEACPCTRDVNLFKGGSRLLDDTGIRIGSNTEDGTPVEETVQNNNESTATVPETEEEEKADEE